MSSDLGISTRDKESKEAEPEELFQELLHLKDPITYRTLPTTVMVFIKMIPPCLVTGLSWISYCALTTIGFFACNISGDALLTSTLSMTIFLNSMTISAMNCGLTDKVSIAMSEAYGAKDFRRFKKYFCQSLLLGLIYNSLIGAPLMIFIKHILIALHIVPELALSIEGFYWKLILTELLRLAVDLLMIVANSQGIETSFFGLMMANTLLSGCFMFFLCFHVGLVLDGLIYALLMFYSFNLIIFAKVYLLECDKRTRGLVSFAEVVQDFGSFSMGWVKFFLTTWIDWLDWELTSYFVALTHDIHQVAAFGSMINIAYLCFIMQLGFKFLNRTRISSLLSRGYHEAAKRYFNIAFFGLILLNLLLGVILFLSREYISDLYLGNIRESRAYLVQLITVYSFVMCVDPISSVMTITARVTDHMWLSIAVNVVFMIVLTSATHYIIIKVMYLNVVWLSANMYGTYILAFSVLYVKYNLLDWSKIPTKKE